LNPSPDTTAGPGILQSLRRHAILIVVTALWFKIRQLERV